MNPPLRILEISIPHASSSGKFCDAMHLPKRIAQDGFNAVFVLPWMKVNRELSPSPYAVVNHMEVNDELGTLFDAQAWIRACHDAGLTVILDLPLNHTSPAHGWTAHQHWYSKTDDGKMHPPLGTNWNDVVQLNHACDEVKLVCLEVMLFWLNIGVNGFRLDAASFMSDKFVEDIICAVRRTNQHAVFWGDGESYAGTIPVFHAWIHHESFALAKQDLQSWNNLVESYEGNGIFYITNHDTLNCGLSPQSVWADRYLEMNRTLWNSKCHVMQSWPEWKDPATSYSFLLK